MQEIKYTAEVDFVMDSQNAVAFSARFLPQTKAAITFIEKWLRENGNRGLSEYADGSVGYTFQNGELSDVLREAVKTLRGISR